MNSVSTYSGHGREPTVFWGAVSARGLADHASACGEHFDPDGCLVRIRSVTTVVDTPLGASSVYGCTQYEDRGHERIRRQKILLPVDRGWLMGVPGLDLHAYTPVCRSTSTRRTRRSSSTTRRCAPPCTATLRARRGSTSRNLSGARAGGNEGGGVLEGKPGLGV